ncbi:MAG: NFYB/HAP3 family transcription factor subunit [Candidatus Marsarchaeota archaeon]|nr:NFYB/HAP3 family transcription factor subunit [Candidatus Marsarchaeota archaeon]
MGISRAAIKKIVKKNNIMISDIAADKIAKILENKAQMIAKYAVKRAKNAGRKVVMKEDIDFYKLKFDNK